MNALSIASTQIRQIDGLYSLNDLHKASGGDENKRPQMFLRNDQTQALLTEINQCANLRSALNVVNGGANRGTYACKEIVIAYGAWLNPAIHLQVIRVFLVQQEQAAPLLESSTITKEQVGIIYQTLCAKYPNGDNRHAAWSRFNKHFNLNEYKSLPAARYDEAMKWLGVEAKAPPVLPAPTEPEPQQFKLKAGERYTLTTNDDGAMTLHPMKPSEFIASMATLGKRMNDLAFGATDEQLMSIVAGCKQVLAHRVEAAEKQLGNLKRLIA